VETAAALDPHIRLIVADGKCGKDWKAFELVARTGSSPTPAATRSCA
jgi:hypothetical protein